MKREILRVISLVLGLALMADPAAATSWCGIFSTPLETSAPTAEIRLQSEALSAALVFTRTAISNFLSARFFASQFARKRWDLFEHSSVPARLLWAGGLVLTVNLAMATITRHPFNWSEWIW